jgi:hypothetical protein
MGLLLSDITLTDPMARETMRLLDDLSELGYEYDTMRDAYEDDGADVRA